MTKPAAKPSAGIPHRAGSLQKRSSNWWAIYFDADQKRRQENTWTDDPAKARVYLLTRSVAVAQERAARLQRLLHEAIRAASPRGGQR